MPLDRGKKLKVSRNLRAKSNLAKSKIKLTQSFEMNNRRYMTDAQTLKVLRVIVPRAKKSGDVSAVTAVMTLGLKFGRIKEVA